MAFSFRQLVSGASDVLSGNLEGKIAGTERRKKDEEADAVRQQKARLDAIREQLLRAQAGYYSRRPGPGRVPASGQGTDLRALNENDRATADAGRSLKAVQRAFTTPPLGFDSPGEHAQFTADSSAAVTPAQDRFTASQARGDTLRARVQGRPGAIPPGPTPGQRKPVAQRVGELRTTLGANLPAIDAQLQAEGYRKGIDYQ